MALEINVIPNILRYFYHFQIEYTSTIQFGKLSQFSRPNNFNKQHKVLGIRLPKRHINKRDEVEFNFERD